MPILNGVIGVANSPVIFNPFVKSNNLVGTPIPVDSCFVELYSGDLVIDKSGNSVVLNCTDPTPVLSDFVVDITGAFIIDINTNNVILDSNT